MPGPPQKPDAVRRNVRIGPLKLPAGGRTGEPPAWPLDVPPSDAELATWADLWRTPHAVAWERLEWFGTVARYCRVSVAAGRPRAAANLLAQAVALEDRLGLTPKAMRMLLWVIVEDEVAQIRSGPRDRAVAV